MDNTQCDAIMGKLGSEKHFDRRTTSNGTVGCSAYHAKNPDRFAQEQVVPKYEDKGMTFINASTQAKLGWMNRSTALTTPQSRDIVHREHERRRTGNQKGRNIIVHCCSGKMHHPHNVECHSSSNKLNRYLYRAINETT